MRREARCGGGISEEVVVILCARIAFAVVFSPLIILNLFLFFGWLVGWLVVDVVVVVVVVVSPHTVILCARIAIYTYIYIYIYILCI